MSIVGKGFIDNRRTDILRPMRNQMFERTAAMLGLMTIMAAPALFGADVFAADPEARAGKDKPALVEKRPAATRPNKSRPNAGGAAAVRVDGDASSRCRPDEDIACTVVRETAQGVLIVTYRASARAAGASASERKTWAVVSGAPAGASSATAGTVYVVPSLPQNQVAATSPATGLAPGHASAVTVALPNGAPILE